MATWGVVGMVCASCGEASDLVHPTGLTVSRVAILQQQIKDLEAENEKLRGDIQDLNRRLRAPEKRHLVMR